MRRRRRRARRKAALNDVLEYIERQYTPKGGFQKIPQHEDAKKCLAAARDAALRGYEIGMQQAAMGNYDQGIYNQIYDRGVQHGVERGREEAFRNFEAERRKLIAQAKRKALPSQQELERARFFGYQQGLQAGMSMQKQPPPQAPGPSQKDFMDKVLAECRTIGESNPNMEPAMKALKHRLKKIN